ncbi:MAG TPA: toll/interleukin-1 receptor domain-containing protein [Pyrinomonadaceae bacterium]|nr:toll/interleukin-1 receptor domain-containing protein [Pyrinomonadaceae bacterium]
MNMPPSSTQQFSGIFVSYRRDDTSGHAGRLADRLVEHFGRNRIFMDIDTIEPGEDFVTVIETHVGSCEILIAVIGQKWLAGTGRLDNPNNFVRLEIATALRRNIRVIPVLVQRANMPKAEDLPEDLVKLTRRNAIELTDLRWQTDVDQLISVLEKVLAKEVKAEQQPQKVEEKQRVDEPLVVAEKESAEQRDVREAPVPESKVPATENRVDAPAAVVRGGGSESPFYKYRRPILIAAASLVVLLTATILIWRSLTAQSSPGNTNEGAISQPSEVTQSSPAKTAPTAESKPTTPPDPFNEPTKWTREDGGSVVQIVRNGNTITAIMSSPSASAARVGRTTGDLTFKGTYKDRTIKGTIYIRMTKEDVSRCPEFAGDRPVDLVLTLSEDGNILTGSREDYVLSDDCTVEPRPRYKLKLTKTSF